jgi:hypothetical protein
VDLRARVVQIPVMQAVDLERRASAGEPDAQFALATELLAGPDSAVHLQRGIALMEGASAAGHAAASELSAVFEAMGIARPLSWERAFDCLQLAAEQGSRTAGGQLLLIADNSRDPVVPEAPPVGFWAEVRARASVEGMLQHGERRSLCDGPRIRVIDGFATPPECRWLIERARARLKPAVVFDADGTPKFDPGRSNTATEFLVPDMDVVLELIRARISSATKVPLPVFEPTQIFRYAVGQEFKRHHDFLDPGNPAHHEQLRSGGQRIATFLIYLNDGFQGGETEFPAIDIRNRGRVGDAIFWANLDVAGQPDPLTVHAGLPPTSGEKWVLSQWVRDRRPNG